MTAGTKIFLAVVGLFVLLLVIYYGFLLPDDRPQVVYDEQDSSADKVEPRDDDREPRIRPTRRTPPSPREEPVVRPTGPIDRSPPSTTQEEPSDDVRPLSDAPLFSPVGFDDSDDDRRADGESVEDDEEAAPEELKAEKDDTDESVSEESAIGVDEVRPVEPSPSIPQRPEYTKYTVEQGDTLSTIAEDWFGDASKWDLIAKANPRVDPLRLRIGQELRLPPKDTKRDDADADAPDHETVYTVRSGDTLSRIAHMYYNNSSRWQLIFDANRDTLRNDPDRLRVGMQLRIPPAPAPAERE